MRFASALFLSMLMGAAMMGASAFATRTPTAPDPVASAVPVPAVCEAAQDGKCDCFDNGGCKCTKEKQCLVSAERRLTTAEVLAVYDKHHKALSTWIETAGYVDSDHSLKELVELWLAENPKYDPRVPRAAVAEPRLTQPATPTPVATVAKQAALPAYRAAAPAYRYEWRPVYGRRGRQTGSQLVLVPNTPVRNTGPVRYYTGGSCAGGRCR